jgi:hypothetical protein
MKAIEAHQMMLNLPVEGAELGKIIDEFIAADAVFGQSLSLGGSGLPRMQYSDGAYLLAVVVLAFVELLGAGSRSSTSCSEVGLLH